MRFDVPIVAEGLGCNTVLISGMDRNAGACSLMPADQRLCLKSLRLMTAGWEIAPGGDQTLWVCGADWLLKRMPGSLPANLAVACRDDQTCQQVLDAATGHVQALAAVQEKDGVSELLNRIEVLLAELGEWDERMLATWAATGSHPAVLEVAATRLTNPIALFDLGNVLISFAGQLPHGAETTIWDEVLTRGYSPLSYCNAREQRAISKQMLDNGIALIAPHQGHGHWNLAAAITAKGQPWGSIAQVDVCGPFTPAQQSLFMQVRFRLEQMADSTALENHPRVEAAHYLRMVLENRDVPGGLLNFHLRERGWSLHDAYLLLCLPLGIQIDDEANRQAYVHLMCDALPEALVVDYEDALVAVVHVSDFEGRSSEVAKRLAGLLGEAGALVGLSSELGNLLEVRSAYRQARIAYEIGKRKQDAGVVSFDDVFADYLAGELGRTCNLHELGHPAVLRMLEKVRADRCTEVLRCLYVYMLCGCNTAQAAKRLFMHRNTLDYRLRAIAKEMDIDAENLTEDECFRIALTCLLALHG